jgi:hypothetical protein
LGHLYVDGLFLWGKSESLLKTLSSWGHLTPGLKSNFIF